MEEYDPYVQLAALIAEHLVGDGALPLSFEVKALVQKSILAAFEDPNAGDLIHEIAEAQRDSDEEED